MTQDVATPGSANALEGAAGSTTVGGTLRALRVGKGWSIEEVAGRIKFAPRQIDALENERWADLPAGVSLRGLIRNYARLLGADPQAIIASLDPSLRGAEPARLVQGALHPRGAGAHVEEERSSSSWGWLAAILVVIIAAIAYAFWQGWLPQHWITSWFPHSGQ
jgi:cytoskeletal protein RodZ